MIDIKKYSEQEADWIHYYGHSVHRLSENFYDINFYDRIQSIGYTKRVIPLWRRCAGLYVTSNKNVLKSSIDELIPISEPRNHDKNIYTILEYIIGTEHESREYLINKIKYGSRI